MPEPTPPAPPAPRIAIVGSGPGGFYTAEALLRALPTVQVDMFERLAAPHGLVRYGVAPDHQKLKQVSMVFDRIAQDPRFAWHGLVDIGTDITLDDLQSRYHAVVLASGAATGQRLGVPGEDLSQVFSSVRFVGWYNGHPDHIGLAPDLSARSAAIVGHGNVALDVARLLVQPYDALRASDIPEPMMAAFQARGVRRLDLVGRGAVTATRFTFKEFRQLVELPGLRVCVPQAATWPDAVWTQPCSDDAARIAQWLRAHGQAANTHEDGLTVNFWFHAAPAGFGGDGRVRSLALRPTDALAGALPATLPCDLAVTCVGYKSPGVAGLPQDPRTGALQHRQGQVVNPAGQPVAGLFVAGWAKRGPNGIIGTNRACGYETADTLIAQLPALLARGRGDGLTTERLGTAPLSYAHWRQLDQWERQRGLTLGKPREKILSAVHALHALAHDGVD